MEEKENVKEMSAFGKIRFYITWSWTYLWIVWVVLVVMLVYMVKYGSTPNTLIDSALLNQATSYFNNLTPKFYVALTGTSSLVSGIILIFEWWYFKSSGVETASEDGSDNEDSVESAKAFADCKVWRNPMSLLRGAEYLRAKKELNLDPLTYHDMNLTAADHQNMFVMDEDIHRPDYDVMSRVYRERDLRVRMDGIREALRINSECVPALIMVAEEECTTVAEAEAMFKKALKAIENPTVALPSSSNVVGQLEKYGSDYQHRAKRRDLNMLIYVKRRLAMCARKQGRVRDAIKLFKDILRDSCSTHLGVTENLVEACLEMQAYADIQGLLVRYDECREPRSACMSYTSALLKARVVADKFIDGAHRRALSSAETTAIEAIMRAIEYNPHVPLYLLEIKPMILPSEHYVKRGDSEAVTYAFNHLQHWKRIDGALQLLSATWKGELIRPYHVVGYCYPYPPQVETTERELLPHYHKLSVYPKRESAYSSLFYTFLCLVVCVMAVIAHYNPDSAYEWSLMLVAGIGRWFSSIFNTFYHWLPENAVGLLSAKPLQASH